MKHLNVQSIPSNADLMRGGLLIEVMICALLLAAGLLAVLASQSTGMQSTRNAYQYLKANALVNEMVERVLSNAEAASSYEGVTSDFSDQAIPSCVSDDSGCTAADRVTADQREWAELFIAAAKNGNEQTVLPDGLGAVEVDDDTSVIAVWVQWRQDDRANVAQSDTDCDEVPAGFIRVCARFSVLEGI